MARRLLRRAAIAAIALAAGAGPVLSAQQPATDLPSAASGTSAVSVPARFTGYWDYNDEESINAGTGRREQTPQSATARSAASNTSGSPRGASGPAGAPGGFESPGASRGLSSVTANMIRNAENFVRDLLEVPERLEISATADAVTFVDDLSRQRTYPTDGKGREYHLSASTFDAKVTWDGPQLRREVEGGSGFKIFETYFLSDDGNRLFVVIRVKAPSRPGFVAGFNRVYDRVGGRSAPLIR